MRRWKQRSCSTCSLGNNDRGHCHRQPCRPMLWLHDPAILVECHDPVMANSPQATCPASIRRDLPPLAKPARRHLSRPQAASWASDRLPHAPFGIRRRSISRLFPHQANPKCRRAVAEEGGQGGKGRNPESRQGHGADRATRLPSCPEMRGRSLENNKHAVKGPRDLCWTCVAFWETSNTWKIASVKKAVQASTRH